MQVMGQNKLGFGFCVNSTSESILSNSAYLPEKNTLHIHSFKNKLSFLYTVVHVNNDMIFSVQTKIYFPYISWTDLT